MHKANYAIPTRICCLCLGLAFLTGCGDDPSISIESGGMERLAESMLESTVSEEAEETQEAAEVSEDEAQGLVAEPMPTKEAVETPEPTENSVATESEEDALHTYAHYEITISAAGDVTLGTYPAQEGGYSFRQVYDSLDDEGYFFQNVYEIFSSDDLTLVNLEGPLTTSTAMRENQTYCIKGDPEYVRLLTLGSIEAVSFANNHRLDYGTQGSEDTIAALNEEGIVYAYDDIVGIYEVPDSAAATDGERNLFIGMIAVNEVEQGSQVEKKIQTGIETLQEAGVDLIIVSCHWGVESENIPEAYQQTLGRKCIDWGADLVLGHHPHVLQGIEVYQGRYIVYSLGNFCFGANRNPSDKDTIIYQQTFTFSYGEKVEDSVARIIPCRISSSDTKNNFQPTPAEAGNFVNIIRRMNRYSNLYGVEFDDNGNILVN